MINSLQNHAAVVISSICFLSLAACAPARKSTPANVWPSAHRYDKKSTPDEGQWTLPGLLKGLRSSEHYVIDADFLKTGSYFILHSHFNGFEWRDGVEVKLAREDDRHFTVTITAPDQPGRSADLTLDRLLPDQRGRWRIEVRNADPAGVRVLIWADSITRQGVGFSPRDQLVSANADFDTQKEKWYFSSHGRGAQWGLELSGVLIQSVHRESPVAW